MDYCTKPISRENLRRLAEVFRFLFNIDRTKPVPVLGILEEFPSVFSGTSVSIVEDLELPPNIPTRCYSDENANFTIEIKESVYMGAYEKGVGAYLGFIMHEMIHIFLYKLGYKPINNREFENNEIPAYMSVEWQTKALTGEVMMPYEETKGMSVDEIQQNIKFP